MWNWYLFSETLKQGLALIILFNEVSRKQMVLGQTHMADVDGWIQPSTLKSPYNMANLLQNNYRSKK